MGIVLLMILALAIISLLLTAYCELLEKKFDKHQKFSLADLIEEATKVLPMDSTKFTVKLGIAYSFTPESTIRVRKRKFYNITHVSILVHELAHLSDYHNNRDKWKKTRDRRLIAIVYMSVVLAYSNIVQLMGGRHLPLISIFLFCGLIVVFALYLENLLDIEIYACKVVSRIFLDKTIRKKALISLISQVMDNICVISLIIVFNYIWLGF